MRPSQKAIVEGQEHDEGYRITALSKPAGPRGRKEGGDRVEEHPLFRGGARCTARRIRMVSLPWSGIPGGSWPPSPPRHTLEN